jgi:hypothetical protein
VRKSTAQLDHEDSSPIIFRDAVILVTVNQIRGLLRDLSPDRETVFDSMARRMNAIIGIILSASPKRLAMVSEITDVTGTVRIADSREDYDGRYFSHET